MTAHDSAFVVKTFKAKEITGCCLQPRSHWGSSSHFGLKLKTYLKPPTKLSCIHNFMLVDGFKFKSDNLDENLQIWWFIIISTMMSCFFFFLIWIHIYPFFILFLIHSSLPSCFVHYPHDLSDLSHWIPVLASGPTAFHIGDGCQQLPLALRCYDRSRRLSCQ